MINKMPFDNLSGLQTHRKQKKFKCQFISTPTVEILVAKGASSFDDDLVVVMVLIGIVVMVGIRIMVMIRLGIVVMAGIRIVMIGRVG
jgi:hypothetical protein